MPVLNAHPLTGGAKGSISHGAGQSHFINKGPFHDPTAQGPVHAQVSDQRDPDKQADKTSGVSKRPGANSVKSTGARPWSSTLSVNKSANTEVRAGAVAVNKTSEKRESFKNTTGSVSNALDYNYFKIKDCRTTGNTTITNSKSKDYIGYERGHNSKDNSSSEHNSSADDTNQNSFDFYPVRDSGFESFESVSSVKDVEHAETNNQQDSENVKNDSKSIISVGDIVTSGSTGEKKASPRNRSSIITTLSPNRSPNKRSNGEGQFERSCVTNLSARKPLLGTASLQQQSPGGTSIPSSKSCSRNNSTRIRSNSLTGSSNSFNRSNSISRGRSSTRSYNCIGTTYKSQMPTPETTPFNASQALKDCEELTSWANEVLKSNSSASQVSDLRRSVADGVTLAELVQTLSGERVPGVTLSSGVLTRGQKTDNLEQIVDCLSKQGVDVSSVLPKELADGNLKATLTLMNSLRRRYDQPSQRETADGAVQPHRTSSRPNSAHARIPPDPSDMPPPLKPRTSSRSSDVSNMIYRRQHEAALDFLPGSLASKEENLKVNGMNGMPPIISTTELDSLSAKQRGVDERRAYLPPPTRQAPAPPPRPGRNSLDQSVISNGPPSTATQAWVSSNASTLKHATNGNAEIEEAVSQTVGERLKSLLSPGGNQPTRLPSSGPPARHVAPRSIPNAPAPTDDGELLLPPPRKPHEQYYGSWPGIDNKGLDNSDVTIRHHPPGQSPVAHHDEEDLYPSSYVPSHPTERSKASRGQVILDRSVRPSPTESSSPSRFNMPGQYPSYSPSAGQRGVNQPPPPPRYQPPPQYGSNGVRQNGVNGSSSGGNVNQAFISSPKPVPKVVNSDLRNVCSRLYGSTQDVTTARNSQSYPNGQGDTGTWNKYNGQNQPRASPQGQSNSTPASHSSSSYSHSPGSSGGQDRSSEPPRPPPPSSARMAGLTSPAQLPINEMSRLSIASTNGHSYSNRPGALPQGPHPHYPDSRQQPSDKPLANKPPPHSMHGERTLNQNNSGAPNSLRQPPRNINGNGVYSQVNRDHPHERTQGSEPKTNEKKLNNGAPELPPKRMDPSPVMPRHAANRAGVPVPPSYKDTLEMQQLRTKPEQLGVKPGSGAISQSRNNQVEYDSALGIALQNVQMPPPGKWQGSVNLNNGDFPLNGRYSPSASSRSITPPLPPLSPADTPPVTPPDSPGTKYRKQISNPQGFLPDKTPDVVNSAKKGIPPSGRRKSHRKQNGGVAVKTWDGRHKRMSTAKSSSRPSSSRPYANGRPMSARSEEDDSDQFDGDSHLGSTTAASGTEVDVDEREIRVIRQQLQGLETMYHEILKLLGVDQDQGGSRRSISSQSSISRTGRRPRHPHSRGGVGRSREIKQINKRFARLESHVVTLARSVAHLSSEMRTHVTNHPDIEEIKKEIKKLKELSIRGDHKAFANEWERFRGWVPSLTNPKRVNKLTQFFGQEPPLLHIFLKKLGYEKYITNFEQERIGMIELPYMTEERLQRIGIPMGPRLRILQEAQMCFRQENFDIYIV